MALVPDQYFFELFRNCLPIYLKEPDVFTSSLGTWYLGWMGSVVVPELGDREIERD